MFAISSSTIKSLYVIALFLMSFDWNGDSESRAGAGRAVDRDRAAVFLDDAVTDRKTESGTVADGLRSEKRIEDAAQVFGLDAAAGVADGHDHRFAFDGGRDRDLAFAFDRLRGVNEQVGPHLIQLARVTRDRRQRAVVAHQANGAAAVVTRNEANRGGETLPPSAEF